MENRSIRIRPARPGEEPRLKELWKVCFGDDDSYIDRFFQGCYVPGQALVLEEGGTVWSMLLVFRQELAGPDGRVLPFWYVYAFCTHPEGRSRGYGRRLLAWTEELAREKGARGVVMVPGEKSLFEFYAALGYETICSVTEAPVLRGAGPFLPVKPCALAEYLRLRELVLRDRWRVRYPARSARWQERLCADSGGGLFRVGDGLAAVERAGDRLFVKELLSDAPEQAARSLLDALGAGSALVRTPVPVRGGGKPFGVMKWLDDRARDEWKAGSRGWLAFAFD